MHGGRIALWTSSLLDEPFRRRYSRHYVIFADIAPLHAYCNILLTSLLKIC